MSENKYIKVTEHPTPLDEKYCYTESQGLWYVISLLSRDEQEDRIMFEARVEDILWRPGRLEIGDTFSFGCSKKMLYGSWKLNLLEDGLQLFLEDYGGKASLQDNHPTLDLETQEGIIDLIKIMKRDKWKAKMEKRYRRHES
jgi:hypothetical protein